MMAGGTGITPMLQIISAVMRETGGPGNSSRIEMSLLFANKSEDDILLRGMIEKLVRGCMGEGQEGNFVEDTEVNSRRRNKRRSCVCAGLSCICEELGLLVSLLAFWYADKNGPPNSFTLPYVGFLVFSSFLVEGGGEPQLQVPLHARQRSAGVDAQPGFHHQGGVHAIHLLDWYAST